MKGPENATAGGENSGSLSCFIRLAVVIHHGDLVILVAVLASMLAMQRASSSIPVAGGNDDGKLLFLNDCRRTRKPCVRQSIATCPLLGARQIIRQPRRAARALRLRANTNGSGACAPSPVIKDAGTWWIWLERDAIRRKRS